MATGIVKWFNSEKGFGFISWALVNALSGRARKVHWLMWVVAAGFALYFVRGPVEQLLGH